MRVVLFMGQSQFLISDENVSGNCSELIIGWPSHPFPDIGEIKLMFSLDERKNQLRPCLQKPREIKIFTRDFLF